MATDPKNNPAATGLPTPHEGKGVRIFTYPKVIFLYPTLIVSLICGLIMISVGRRSMDLRPGETQADRDARIVERISGQGEPGATKAQANAQADAKAKQVAAANKGRLVRFLHAENIAGAFFLVVLGFNLLVMSLDFPRFTIFAILITAVAAVFFLLWLNVYFDFVPALANMLESIYLVANAQFYFMVATILLVDYAIIYVTRYLDYWVILPNEILHNHGPFSDLERFPTFNLRFGKEIPDILEYLMLGAGTLVLHVSNERRAIVLENVIGVTRKEEELKRMMSRMEVRVTTDQEVGEA
ncbi:MAG TPA: hypothetical protein VG406_07365 [Isosphaeraceae bacterium]|jgi:hypothetical protein|nr:hypothetical protein [Isosphaeraceae bacterium]